MKKKLLSALSLLIVVFTLCLSACVDDPYEYEFKLVGNESRVITMDSTNEVKWVLMRDYIEVNDEEVIVEISNNCVTYDAATSVVTPVEPGDVSVKFSLKNAPDMSFTINYTVING